MPAEVWHAARLSYKGGMITLYQFISYPGLPNFSPFCMKVENYLRMTGIEHKTALGDVRRAPKRKLPYIDDGGTLVADSGAIFDHLKRKFGDPLDDGLTDAQRGRSHLLRRTFEESLYFPLVYSRWIPEESWKSVRAQLGPMIPVLLRSFLPEVIRKGVRKQLYLQGTARHSPDEVYALGGADLDAIALTLGDHPFFGGEKPRSIDAIAYAFLGNVLFEGFPKTPLAERARAKANLVAYAERMKARLYP